MNRPRAFDFANVDEDDLACPDYDQAEMYRHMYGVETDPIAAAILDGEIEDLHGIGTPCPRGSVPSIASMPRRASYADAIVRVDEGSQEPGSQEDPVLTEP